MSSHDQPINGKYLGMIHELISPASIYFNMSEAVNKFNDYKVYTIVVPTAGSEKIERDMAILVFRLDMTEIGAVFVTIRDFSHGLLVRTILLRYEFTRYMILYS